MNGKIWLISYPRSGTNWVAYIIENVCRLRVEGVHIDKSLVYNEEVHNSDALTILKSHMDNVKFVREYDAENDYLICVVRNYKESIVAHGLAKFDFDRFKSKTKGYGSFDYINVLKVYDENKNDKLLIYYEDLLTDCRHKGMEIVEFLKQFGGKVSIIDWLCFVTDIEEHKERSLKIYGNTISYGKDLKYYSKQLTPEMRTRMDLHLETKHSEIYNKYLLRYKEDTNEGKD